MEKQYIEKKEIVAVVNELPRVWDKKCGISMLEYLKIRINNISPAADVVEVVRCRDCRHYREEPSQCRDDAVVVWCGAGHYPTNAVMPDDWFCAAGQRREK